ncbi:hypothetical protein O1L44_19665 [Streptomyces noursei]|uniref:hypothetical protein n=1 Tax=Streptomyces noursei TaxID=1971 RepID=UPI000832A879|nr:hypothetical protein [Streptomyces noursei]
MLSVSDGSEGFSSTEAEVAELGPQVADRLVHLEAPLAGQFLRVRPRFEGVGGLIGSALEDLQRDLADTSRRAGSVLAKKHQAAPHAYSST